MPRLCESLFDASQFGAAWGVTLSFFEVYNEQVVGPNPNPNPNPTLALHSPLADSGVYNAQIR